MTDEPKVQERATVRHDGVKRITVFTPRDGAGDSEMRNLFEEGGTEACGLRAHAHWIQVVDVQVRGLSTDLADNGVQSLKDGNGAVGGPQSERAELGTKGKECGVGVLSQVVMGRCHRLASREGKAKFLQVGEVGKQKKSNRLKAMTMPSLIIAQPGVLRPFDTLVGSLLSLLTQESDRGLVETVIRPLGLFKVQINCANPALDLRIFVEKSEERDHFPSRIRSREADAGPSPSHDTLETMAGEGQIPDIIEAAQKTAADGAIRVNRVIFVGLGKGFVDGHSAMA